MKLDNIETDEIIEYSEKYIKSMSKYSDIENIKFYLYFYGTVAKKMKKLIAFEMALDEIRSLTQVWEEGAGIKKCLDIIDNHLNRGKLDD